MIELLHINKKYGHKQVLKDISLSAKSGECIAIVGKNGCGKSTLLQIMAGIIPADSGDICYFGQEVKRNKKLFQKYCGYVPQENPLMEELTVRDNLRLWGWNYREDSRDVIQQLELQDLLNDRVDTLSGGMKRRLSIACSILKEPPIVLLDEPTTALDFYQKEKVHQWMNRYCKGDAIVIMITHDESEIVTADRCMVMMDGSLREIKDKATRLQQIRECIMNKGE